MRRLGDEEIRAFLTAGTRTGKLAVTRLDGSPMVVPVWFAVDDDGTLLFTTWHDTIKGKALRRDGRVSLCVDEEQPPYAYVRVDGVAALSEDPEQLRAWAARIGARYMGRRARRGVRAAQRRARRAARARHADAHRRRGGHRLVTRRAHCSARAVSRDPPLEASCRRCARSRWKGMLRLRRAAVLAAVLATAAAGVAASPAAAADRGRGVRSGAALPASTWTAPSFLAWGREARVGANVADPGLGPGLRRRLRPARRRRRRCAKLAASPVDSDLEFVVRAPARGVQRHGQRDLDAPRRDGHRRLHPVGRLHDPARRRQGSALCVADARQRRRLGGLGRRRLPRHRAAAGQPDRAGRARSPAHLTAPDQCSPAATRRVATA